MSVAGAIGGATALGGFGLAGDLIGGALNFHYQNELMDKQNNFNSVQAQLNRDFQASQNDLAYERSKRSVQDRVEDLRSAGLNPYMAFSGGTQTPTPMGGSVASSGSGNTSAGSQFGHLGVDLVNTAFRMFEHNRQMEQNEKFMRMKLDYMNTARAYARRSRYAPPENDYYF